MRYVVGFGEDPETAGLLTSTGGGSLLYDTLEEAGNAGKTVLKGTLATMHPTWNAFVFKLVPAALYMPIPSTAGEPIIDETVLEKETNDTGPN